VGQEFNDHNFDFYALDLRKYGRSLLVISTPYCKDIREYYEEEISIAIRQIQESSNNEIFCWLTQRGGLIASNYMNDGQERDLIKGLILNSPFRFQSGQFSDVCVCLVAKLITGIFPYAKSK
jgi:alpha-beta hydrolase superfamily lysophospholipase